MSWPTKKQQKEVDSSFFEQPVATVDDSFFSPIEKKNGGGQDSSTQSNLSAPTGLQSKSIEKKNEGNSFGVFPTAENIIDTNKRTIITSDGVPFHVKDVTPYLNTDLDVQMLQQRVNNKTATNSDIAMLSRESGKSPKATEAYVLYGKDKGSAVEVTDNVAKTNNDIINTVSYVNGLTPPNGLKLDANEVLNSADKSAELLNSIKKMQEAQAGAEADAQIAGKLDATSLVGTFGITATSPEIAPAPVKSPEAKKIEDDAITSLKYNIRKQTSIEAYKAGLTLEQTGELMYKRLDPEGYAKNQEMRNEKPKTTTEKIFGSLTNATYALNTFKDWITNKDEVKKQALQSEKAQYELEANSGLMSLAIEKKAEAIASGDETVLAESKLLASKVKDNSEIIQEYPLLMLQEMAANVSHRFAAETGILEGTDPAQKKGNKFSSLTTNLVKRYLTEGGYYDKPKYKDYADQILNNPSTYLADNSMSGENLGAAFFKPFKSVFNSAADLMGIRTSTDRHVDAIMEEMFPERLSQGIKEGVSFDLPSYLGGAHVGTNLSNTMYSVANLGGYMAMTMATAGVGTEIGLSSNVAGRAAAWSTWGMDAIDTGLKTADQMGLTPAESWLFAGLKGAMMAEGGRIFDFGKAALPEIKGVNEILVKAAKGITNKTLAEDGAKEVLNNAANVWHEGLKTFGLTAKKYGAGVVKGAGVMSAFGVGDTMLRVAFGDKTVNTDDILPEAANAFFNGLFTMGIIGGAGLKSNIAEAKNSTQKGMLTKVIDNHDATLDVLKISLDKGFMSPEEYDQKVQILNVGLKAKSTLNNILSKTGINLTPEQRSSWIANATIEKSLRHEADNPDVNEAQKKIYLEQADNLSKQNTETLDGLSFNKFLEPRVELYNAQKELQLAQADFTADGTPENEKILLAKKAAVDEINYKEKLNIIEQSRVNELDNSEGNNRDEINAKYTDAKNKLIADYSHLNIDSNGEIKKASTETKDAQGQVLNPDGTVADKKSATDLQNQNDVAVQQEISTHEADMAKEIRDLQKPEVGSVPILSATQLANSKLDGKEYNDLRDTARKLKALINCL